MRLSELTKAAEPDWPFKSLEDNCAINEKLFEMWCVCQSQLIGEYLQNILLSCGVGINVAVFITIEVKHTSVLFHHVRPCHI